MGLIINTALTGQPVVKKNLVSRIAVEIAPARYEEIRDRIASILLVELQAQSILQSDAKVGAILGEAKVYSERFSPFHEDEMLAISVFLASVNYDNKNQQAARGTNVFYLDCYGTEPAGSTTGNGQQKNAVDLQKVVAIIRAILEHPQWVRLGFDPTLGQTFINSHEVISIKRMEEENTRDSGNIIMYRVIFQVVATENTTGINGTALTTYLTNVKIAETDKGYQYIFRE